MLPKSIMEWIGLFCEFLMWHTFYMQRTISGGSIQIAGAGGAINSEVSTQHLFKVSKHLDEVAMQHACCHEQRQMNKPWSWEWLCQLAGDTPWGVYSECYGQSGWEEEDIMHGFIEHRSGVL